MTQSKDALTWFEIPAADLHRATRFYEPGVGGCLIAGDGQAPAATGTVVYLAVSNALDDALDRVKGAGGKIALPKTVLPEGMGVFAHVIDSEGNRVGLHALK